ncbi:FecCD family ABC transporter permease [Bosea sp. (in: a-proteobacteria)]|jgi:iron complex transport system permease protein|uniref:FecCD family ABC transporter permease n=1 Tax=Bosea sp. (in: a-proteobacteria) TaxID=1871050 RepID=UPI002DDD12D2|nr:iron chelate uptake ABC transporter family permease subunit [Bosea sp. (in: a-proteobacteria)]HEV2508980.1 iron chelate uptake ABC transporter family permease subunit [Bosea sp. (in: a-proteobacteria)]
MSGLATLRLGPFSLRWRPRTALVCAVLAGAALALAVVLLGTGTLAFAPAEVVAALFCRGENPMAERVVWGLRLPRVVTAACVGAALGMAGAIFQSISRNALGSPDIIGFTTGAATGAIVQIILFGADPFAVALAAVLSGMATAALVFLLALKGRVTGGYRLVLVGIGVGATLSGVNTILLVASDLDRSISAQIWLAGSLTARSWSHAAPAALGLVLIVPVALLHARRLALLEMGDDAASQLGVPVERTRLAMVLTAVGLTAMATAAAGPIAFIALAGPQLARRLCGSPDVPLLPGAAMGAVLLLAADLVSQRVPTGLNLPIGLTTGLLGGIYLLWRLARDERV